MKWVCFMVEQGLQEVENPSALFLDQGLKATPGSAVVGDGRDTSILVEIRALVVDSQPQCPDVWRESLPRIQLLCAPAKHCGLPLSNMDVFINVAGGFVVQEPAADGALRWRLPHPVQTCRFRPTPRMRVKSGC